MSDYLYPYDATASDPDCLVKNEQIALENFPNDWNTIIPVSAPFYRKDLTIKHVESGRTLHEGVDFYLGHYYQAASEENKIPVFGSIMIIDNDLTGTIEFVQYRTLGGRYTTIQRIITEYLSKEGLGNPRNADWEEVIRQTFYIPSVDAPTSPSEAISGDLLTGGLDRVRAALARLNETNKTAFDAAIKGIETLATRVVDEEIQWHEDQQDAHAITSRQLGAVAKYGDAADAVLAYGYNLAQLATIINGLGIAAKDTDDLFKLIGDTLEGRLSLAGDTAIIKDSQGYSTINLQGGNLNIISRGGITLATDTNADDEGIPAILRAGDNQLSLHSYKKKFTKPVETVYTSRAAADRSSLMKLLAPTKTHGVANERFMFCKRITFPGGDVNFQCLADDTYRLYIDGELITEGSGWTKLNKNTAYVSEGDHWVTYMVNNTTGPVYGGMAADIDGSPFFGTDTDWDVFIYTGMDHEDAVKILPTDIDDVMVYNNFYVLHAGNINDYLPPADYIDAVLLVESTDSVKLTGQGTAASRLTGYVNYPITSKTGYGIFRFSDSIYSDNETLAASAYAVKILNDLLSDKADNTITVNGSRLNKNITITKNTIGLGNVDNTPVEEKPLSPYFQQEADKLATVGHTHNAEDITGLPVATEEAVGLTKYAPSLNGSKVTVSTPSMVTDAYSEYIKAESVSQGMMPSDPFNIMQYGGFTYLPVPVQGHYGAAAMGSGYYSTVMEIESDGTLVLLRSGADESKSGVYYWYTDFKSNGDFNETVSTATPYEPDFLNGVKAESVGNGSEGCFILRDANGDAWVVLTSGTMDSRKHRAGKIVDFNGMPDHYSIMTSLYKDKIIFHINGVKTSGTAVYFRQWECSQSAVMAGLDITMEPQQFSGIALDGVEYTNKDVAVLINKLSSKNHDDYPLIWENDNNKYNISRRPKNDKQSNSAIVLEGNFLRVTVTNRSLYNSSNSSKWMYYVLTYTVDLTTGIVTFNNPNDYPVELNESGFPAYGSMSLRPWYGATGRTSFPVLHKDTFYYITYIGYRSTPKLCKMTVPLDPFEWLLSDNIGGGDIKSTLVSGNRGSVISVNARNIAFVDGDRIIGTSDGGAFIAKYDTEGSYLDDGKGWGPTTERYTFDDNARQEIVKVPMDWRVGKNRGFTLTSHYKTSSTKVDDVTASGSVSWSDSLINSVKEIIFDGLSLDYELYKDELHLSAFGTYGDPGFITTVTYGAVVFTNDSKTAKKFYGKSFKCDVTIENNVVTILELTDFLNSWDGWGNSVQNFKTSWNDRGNTIHELPTGETVVCVNSTPYLTITNNDSCRAQAYMFDSDHNLIGNWQRNVRRYIPLGFYVHPDLGLFQARPADHHEAIGAALFGNDYDTLMKGRVYDTQIILSTSVASGVVVYFTNEQRYYLKRGSYTLPVMSFDLAHQDVISDYRNKTVYFYATIASNEDGSEYATYELRLTKDDDTDSTLYIGYVTTDDSQVTEVAIDRATRIGDIYELTDHANDPDAHGNLTKLDKNSFGLDKVENMSMIHTLELPTFKEVFDDWQRFSHYFNTTAQPSNSKGIDAWTYVEALDAVQSKSDNDTLHHYVGFVSPDPIGDYVFDTTLYADEKANNDDDWMGVVLAFGTDDEGREHTLSAIRSSGAASQELYLHAGGDKTRYCVGLVYNFHQSDVRILHADIVAPSARYIKNLGETRIVAVRKGDVISIDWYGFEADGEYDTIVSSTTVDLEAEGIEVLRGESQFGYTSQSQGFTTFINNKRPDEDVGNYYASADAIRLLSERQAEAVRFVTGTVAGGSSIPIPEGFEEADCSAVVSYNEISNSVKLTYASATLSGLTCTIKTRMSGGSVVTNATGATARYYLVARKTPEV